MKVRFFSIHQNLDMSNCLHTLRLLSSPVKLNVLGPHLLIASRDSSLTLYNMKLSHDTDNSEYSLSYNLAGSYFNATNIIIQTASI